MLLTADEFTGTARRGTMRGMPSDCLTLRCGSDGYYRTSWYDDAGRPHQRSFGRKKAEARAAFARFYTAWQADSTVRNPADPTRYTLRQVWARFKAWAEARYVRADGRPTGEARALGYAFQPVLDAYGDEPAEQFGPLKLQAVRAGMIRADLCRNEINKRVHKIRRVMAWAVSQELLKSDVYAALVAVDSLRAGEAVEVEPGRMQAARLSAKVRSIPDEYIEEVLAELPATLAALVRFQWLTAARPDEVCSLRPIDIDMTGETWFYQPTQYKSAHLADGDEERRRVIAIGPQAREVLRPFLGRDTQAFVFSPLEAVQQRNASRRVHRHQPVADPLTGRRVGNRYDSQSYGKAVRYAIRNINARRLEQDGPDAALLPIWSPNRLRHTALTTIRKRFGLEASQVVAGHARADVTQIYAEANRTLAAKVARQIG